MALANTHIEGRDGSFVTTLIDLAVRLVENHPRSRQLERLSAMSDEELAAKGLNRQDVVRYIFRDRFYV